MQYWSAALKKHSPECMEGFSTLFACIEFYAKHANKLATYAPAPLPRSMVPLPGGFGMRFVWKC